MPDQPWAKKFKTTSITHITDQTNNHNNIFQARSSNWDINSNWTEEDTLQAITKLWRTQTRIRITKEALRTHIQTTRTTTWPSQQDQDHQECLPLRLPPSSLKMCHLTVKTMCRLQAVRRQDLSSQLKDQVLLQSKLIIHWLSLNLMDTLVPSTLGLLPIIIQQTIQLEVSQLPDSTMETQEVVQAARSRAQQPRTNRHSSPLQAKCSATTYIRAATIPTETYYQTTTAWLLEIAIQLIKLLIKSPSPPRIQVDKDLHQNQFWLHLEMDQWRYLIALQVVDKLDRDIQDRVECQCRWATICRHTSKR